MSDDLDGWNIYEQERMPEGALDPPPWTTCEGECERCRYVWCPAREEGKIPRRPTWFTHTTEEDEDGKAL